MIEFQGHHLVLVNFYQYLQYIDNKDTLVNFFQANDQDQDRGLLIIRIKITDNFI